MLGEERLGGFVGLVDLDRDRDLPTRRELSFEVLLVHEESDGKQVLQEKQGEQAGRFAHLADGRRLALVFAVGLGAEAADLDGAVVVGLDEDLAVATIPSRAPPSRPKYRKLKELERSELFVLEAAVEPAQEVEADVDQADQDRNLDQGADHGGEGNR